MYISISTDKQENKQSTQNIWKPTLRASVIQQKKSVKDWTNEGNIHEYLDRSWVIEPQSKTWMIRFEVEQCSRKLKKDYRLLKCIYAGECLEFHVYKESPTSRYLQEKMQCLGVMSWEMKDTSYFD